MSAAASGQTWEDASSPAATRLTRLYEETWQEAKRSGYRLDPAKFLTEHGDCHDVAGAVLAILRTDLSLRWDAGDRTGARWYLDRFADLDESTLVGLVYEELCLREEDGEEIDDAEFMGRYSTLAGPLKRLLDIHRLIGSGTTNSVLLSGSQSLGGASSSPQVFFPEAGQTIAGFHLVEELGRGSFGRVFLAKERQLADRPVALKVTRKASLEPQALARLQHTHIVPVYSHREDPATNLHLLCMPYLGRVTLANVLREVRREEEPLSGDLLARTLLRLCDPTESSPEVHSSCLEALSQRSFFQAIAWWAARLAEALKHAHERGVLHRDIKPSNVLILDDGMPMILDFNLARDSVIGEETDADATLGGTVDYMAPEHLEALAEGRAERVDDRSDIYGLGVLIYEGVVGKIPFEASRRSLPMIEGLLRAADERRRLLPSLFPDHAGVPSHLKAVILRCMEPDPDDRYQNAGDLAADLQAVADDLPLFHARESLPSRVGRRLRRNRRGMFMAAVVLVAALATLVTLGSHQLERANRYEEAKNWLHSGMAEMRNNRYREAQIWFNNAMARLQGTESSDDENRYLRWPNFQGGGGSLPDRMGFLWASTPSDELLDLIQRKALMASVIERSRGEADTLLEQSEDLRFRLIGLGEDVPGAVDKLKKLMRPLEILEKTKDQYGLPERRLLPDRVRELLDPDRDKQLYHDVNELVFLWMVQIENALRATDEPPEAQRPSRNSETLENALGICQRMIDAWGIAAPGDERGEPWLAMQALLNSYQPSGSEKLGMTAFALLPGEPVDPSEVKSASACFQWGLLCSNEHRPRRAIEWLRQAVLLDWSNYWYQFYLAFLSDRAGLSEDALVHYSAALACKPESAWIHLNLARLYRAKGRWSEAMDDLNFARNAWNDDPKVYSVMLEQGMAFQSLGDFDNAAAQFRAILDAAPGGRLEEAAGLNLAAIEVELGREDAASRIYDWLIGRPEQTHAPRLSRAYLRLRLGKPEAALEDLDELLAAKSNPVNRAEALSARAVALILLRRGEQAVADAAEARRLNPSLSFERLWQRTLLAVGRTEQLDLDRPDEVWLLPVSGALLKADLESAMARLTSDARKSKSQAAYRALLNLAVIRSALGEHQAALDCVASAQGLAGMSSRVNLIKARVLRLAGRDQEAIVAVNAGLQLEPSDPSLLEMQGELLTLTGRPEEALTNLSEALTHSQTYHLFVQRARTLMVLGRYSEAIQDWTIAIRRDPLMPQALVGRAWTCFQLSEWDRAIADLEQASIWAHDNLPLQLGILVAYSKCLEKRPDHWGRWRSLVDRIGFHLPFGGLALFN